MCCDLSDPFSCSLLPVIINNIYRIKQLPPLSIPIAIAMNKVDLNRDSASILKLYALSKDIGASLYETCATAGGDFVSPLSSPIAATAAATKYHQNIQETFMYLIRTAYSLMASQQCEVVLYESDSDHDADDIDPEHICPQC